jgi:hypothetical protein
VTQTNRATSWPIGLRLFNRPEYAQQLISSLKKQTLKIPDHQLHVIIDGYAGSLDEQRGRPNKTTQVASLIRESFPEADIELCGLNLGIAETTYRLQTKVFDRVEAHWAIFLEEDIVLDPQYLEALHHMIDLSEDVAEIVKVAANQINLAYLNLPPKSDRRHFYLGQGTQAFAERRNFFEGRKHLTEIYLKEISGRQYSDRDESEVFATLAEHGVFTTMGNNDVVHDRITMAQKALHIVTPQRLLIDVGVAGETSFAYPDIPLPDSATARVLETTKDDLLRAVVHLKEEAHSFEHKFFKDFWAGYLVSFSGRLAANVLLKKFTKAFKR